MNAVPCSRHQGRTSSSRSRVHSESSDWIEATDTHEGNRPPRRVFRLTEAGEAAFQRLLRENLASYGEARFGGDVGLAFLDALPPAEAHALLVERRAALAAAVAAVEGAPPHGGSLHLVIDHQRYHLRNELGWLDGVIASLAD